ncbi:MAG: hypothetical protein Unbinned400contig1002_31 [Prokaryotic dsDNA virus sp.]|nr:MAG: hypothetical protein Unbinned400contig1002_31 [Prokaryotic dsDNA virus sp.]|tara:strand:+ start:4933 stop:5268 length:336 start_codon:yes stop_codon:yes gene_type:complete
MISSRARAANRLSGLLAAKRRLEPSDDGFDLGDLATGAAAVTGTVASGGNPVVGLKAAALTRVAGDLLGGDSPSGRLDSVILSKAADDPYKRMYEGAGAWLSKRFPSSGGV